MVYNRSYITEEHTLKSTKIKHSFSCPFDKCFISIHFVLCIVFAYVAGGGMYIHVYIL